MEIPIKIKTYALLDIRVYEKKNDGKGESLNE